MVYMDSWPFKFLFFQTDVMSVWKKGDETFMFMEKDSIETFCCIVKNKFLKTGKIGRLGNNFVWDYMSCSII